MFCIFSVFKQEKPLFKVHSSEVNKAKSKWKALLARISHNPPHIRNRALMIDYYSRCGPPLKAWIWAVPSCLGIGTCLPGEVLRMLTTISVIPVNFLWTTLWGFPDFTYLHNILHTLVEYLYQRRSLSLMRIGSPGWLLLCPRQHKAGLQNMTLATIRFIVIL